MKNTTLNVCSSASPSMNKLIPVSSKNQPWSSCSVHCLEVCFKKLVLGRSGVKEMLSTHQNEMGTSIVEPIPEEHPLLYTHKVSLYSTFDCRYPIVM